ncbi:MAG: formate dehydrogenase accessory protein FdhE [Desulfamplus sp.]|nr:formate dehydrogenase accessory protein FdhE [Desulfamplus sp.]
MTINSPITPEQIRKSADMLKQTRPAYKYLIDFYEEMFVIQEESKSELDLDPIIIGQDQIKLKIDKGISLINPDQFVIDVNHAKKLLIKICSIAGQKLPHLLDASQNISAGLSNNSFNAETLFNALLKNDPKALNKIAQTINVNEDALIFFAFEAIAPSIQACSSQLSYYLKSDSEAKPSQEQVPWKKGTCPVCGNIPQMGILNQDGEKYLVCSLCLHRWKTSRMGCSLCQNREKDKQQYFFNEEEKEYRVALCDNCKKYIKIVDLRELVRAFYPPLEQLCSIHLDMQASEQGYQGLVQNKI